MILHVGAMSGVLLLLTALTPIASDADGLKKGMRFLAARDLLMHEKWRPINVHQGDGYEYIGVEKALRTARIDELESCAVDIALCIYNYSRGRECLRLATEGEDIAEMRVYYWTHECPH